MSAGLQGVNFDIIRYANCWEDAGMLLHALNPAQHRRIAIIASAGDNALALLTTAPRSVLAFDISLPQLYLTELKQVAFARLEYPELLQLVGIPGNDPDKSTQLLRHLAPHLSPSAQGYWQQKEHLVRKGLVHAGKFERYFAMFRNWCLPLVHSQNMVKALLAPKDDAAQAAFYHHHWNTLRWRLLMRLFFSKAFMGRAGRDPSFLNQVQVPVAHYIRKRAEAHLLSSQATCNPFLHCIFTGSFGLPLPHYLRPEYFEVIRANIGRLSLQHASAGEVVSMQAHDAYCLSNIFEYYPTDQFENTVHEWAALLPAGAQLLFWNLMVRRSFSALAPGQFASVSPPAVYDNGFFYSAFLAEHRL